MSGQSRAEHAQDARAALAAAAEVIAAMVSSSNYGDVRSLSQIGQDVVTMTQGFLRELVLCRPSADPAVPLASRTHTRTPGGTETSAYTYFPRAHHNVDPLGLGERPDRLTPGVDFRSPTEEETARLDPTAVHVLAAEKATLARTWDHVISKVLTTPSGKTACVCGQSWPCSLRKDHPLGTNQGDR